MYQTWRILGMQSRVLQGSISRRQLHGTGVRHAVTKMAMPAMSPTMTEGGISNWKVKEGDKFSSGDVLLEIETDKATIDVEAQDDGVMGKILAPNGAQNIPVGKTIALLAEEGDDISNLEAPKEDEGGSKKAESSKPPPPPKPSARQEPKDKKVSHEPISSGDIKHDRPLFPSVMRLLQENGITDTKDIKGTGVRGMLTKGDVLAHLGKASSPSGSVKEDKKKDASPKKDKKEQEEPAKESPAKKSEKSESTISSPSELRQRILARMAEESKRLEKGLPKKEVPKKEASKVEPKKDESKTLTESDIRQAFLTRMSKTSKAGVPAANYGDHSFESMVAEYVPEDKEQTFSVALPLPHSPVDVPTTFAPEPRSPSTSSATNPAPQAPAQDDEPKDPRDVELDHFISAMLGDKKIPPYDPDSPWQYDSDPYFKGIFDEDVLPTRK